MQSKVNILADDMGNVVRQSQSNPEFGHVRLGGIDPLSIKNSI